MRYQLLDAESFRRQCALWVLRHARAVPRDGGPREEDFVDSWRLPALDWELTQDYVGADGRIYLHFRAQLRLLSCQTRPGQPPVTLPVWQIRAKTLDAPEEEIVGYGL
jgi:hypothetical protein